MYAYRYLAEGSTHITQDCDDDGEDHAGGRMLHLLQVGCEGDGSDSLMVDGDGSSSLIVRFVCIGKIRWF